MNYGELKTLLKGYLHRADLTDMIPIFITLAQARLNKEVKHVCMDVSTVIAARASNSSITLPTGFLHMVMLKAPYGSGYTPLEQQTAEQLAAAGGLYETPSTPLYYNIINLTTAELLPAPSEDMTLRCIYRKGAVAFVADTDTDVILTNFPNAYLYASLLEATPYIQSDKRLATWGGMYQDEITKISDADFEARWADSTKTISNLSIDTP